MVDIHSTWHLALAGGALIGLSAVILMLSIGRIAGISGIFANLLKLSTFGNWQFAFIAGLFITGLVSHHFYQPLPIEIQANSLVMIISGLLVGFGTRLGNGCTSGHGVCGISRFSIRSLVATIVFIGMGILTVYIARRFLGQ